MIAGECRSLMPDKKFEETPPVQAWKKAPAATPSGHCVIAERLLEAALAPQDAAVSSRLAGCARRGE